jgi:amino-acid N-acetyltransferase
MTTKLIQDEIELEKLKTFLHSNKLPHSDIRLKGNIFIGYYNENGNLIGTGGLEVYGNTALLRSVAVDESMRGKSFGKKIVDDLIEKANSISLTDIYLLTETAHDFFLQRGFTDVARAEVPERVRNSSQFSQLCPASASCMMYKMNG